MAGASEGQVEFSADPTNLSSFMELHEATRSFALPVGSHGVPLDPHEVGHSCVTDVPAVT